MLKFMAHHLYGASERNRDPHHGMPEVVEVELRSFGLLRTQGRPQAPATVTAWMENESIKDGAVFRHIDRWENVSERAMTEAGINHMIKRRLTIAGYESCDYSAHGLRAGYLTQAARDGVPLPETMQQSQHKSVQQVAEFTMMRKQSSAGWHG